MPKVSKNKNSQANPYEKNVIAEKLNEWQTHAMELQKKANESYKFIK